MPYIEKRCQRPNLGFSARKCLAESCDDQLVGELEEGVTHGAKNGV